MRYPILVVKKLFFLQPQANRALIIDDKVKYLSLQTRTNAKYSPIYKHAPFPLSLCNTHPPLGLTCRTPTFPSTTMSRNGTHDSVTVNGQIARARSCITQQYSHPTFFIFFFNSESYSSLELVTSTFSAHNHPTTTFAILSPLFIPLFIFLL